jgi:nicotinamide-nucleotide amidase
VHIEVINTGSELILGRILNTHQQWICRQLADLGYLVNRNICIADDGREIQEAVRESLTRSDLVITTGGLGPTSDDLTRDLIAQLLGRELTLDPETLRHIERFFTQRNRPMPVSTKVQAMVPAGARVLRNDNGTAPGLAIEVRPNPFRAESRLAWLILLPGPPRELRPMFVQSVVPLLSDAFPLTGKWVCRILRTTGLGESLVEERIAGPLQKLVAAGLDLGYCARIGEVEIRLAARGGEADSIVAESEDIVSRLLGLRVYATGDDTLETTLVRMLRERGKTVTLAESCTGGMLAHRLTNVPGASDVLKCGLVTYSNEAKQNFLGVTAAALDEHGAVSEAVARQMAEGARQKCGVDYALSVTGIAGPGGGSEAKPVGTVFMALADEKGTVAEKHFNPFDRETFKYVASQQAMDLLRRRLFS